MTNTADVFQLPAALEVGHRPTPWPSALRKLTDALGIEPFDLTGGEEKP